MPCGLFLLFHQLAYEITYKPLERDNERKKTRKIHIYADEKYVQLQIKKSTET